MNLIELIRAAIREDMPQGDITTESLALGPRYGHAKLIAKQDLVLSGAPPFEQTMLLLDPQVRIKWHFEEGSPILKSQIMIPEILLGAYPQLPNHFIDRIPNHCMANSSQCLDCLHIWLV